MNNIYFQLFKKLPDYNMIINIVELYGIKDLDINYKFTINDLIKLNIVHKLNQCRNELNLYYLNCKFNKYVNNMTEKKSITVLRHFLKVINYKVVSKEKYSNNKKYLVYNIKNNNDNNEIDLTLNFD